jgi:hypothetical protein
MNDKMSSSRSGGLSSPSYPYAQECGIQSLIIYTHFGKPLLHFQSDSTGHPSYDVTALGRCIVSLQSLTVRYDLWRD